MGAYDYYRGSAAESVKTIPLFEFQCFLMRAMILNK